MDKPHDWKASCESSGKPQGIKHHHEINEILWEAEKSWIDTGETETTKKVLRNITKEK